MDMPELARLPEVRRARRILRESDPETIADMIELTEIPSPPFGEAARARRIRERFLELGVRDVTIDEVGNVLARLPDPAAAPDGAGGSGPAGSDPPVDEAAPVLVAAHLDTVFPAETDVTVRRRDGRLCGPGIADNGRGLAVLLALARALTAAGIVPRRPIVLAATVGEEGAGDLRGVKHLFREGSPWRRAAAFIALDGTGRRRIINRAIGSRRLRAVVTGRGGHSWADWGRANPIHALGIAVAEIARHTPPREPRTTFSVGRIAGGTSVNAIPAEAWLEIDIRSEGAAALAELERRIRDTIRAATREVNARRRRSTPALELRIEVIGDRPSAEMPATAPLVAIARAATRSIGETPELVASSTDANIPMALGIPSITLGAGGVSAGTHTLHEWYDNRGGPDGAERVLLTVLGAAGIRSTGDGTG